ncbi:NAD(P)/FAD-dependent oxidoreductase [Liberiplasma polymorphum]|uniref:NAD(P)/FAD-dependent oxidoreductase n=1 Tax=Liberiplasma polymorphum TaxID=3374570 RepID=UPI00377554CC
MFNFTVEKKTITNQFDEITLWDMLIIGGGPAGLNAALYAKRKGLTVGLIAKENGGQLHNTTAVDNYLGFNLIDGEHLANAFVDHVTHLEVPLLKSGVSSIENVAPNYIVTTSNGKKYTTKTLLIATGGSSRKLAIPGENDYANRGVTYCATCDAPFFKGKHVIVAGGGNSAAEGVLDLVPWADKITVVHRSQWRADQILLSKLDKVDKLTVHLETQILNVFGDEMMKGVQVLDKATGEKRLIKADGLLIEIGTIPNSALVKDLVALNEQGEILVDHNQMTSLKGLFAAGDVTAQPHKQIIISAAEGAKAALAANQYLNHTYKGE